jgi:hypothetical protein
MEKIGGTGVREAVIKDISLQLQSRKFKNSHPTTAKSSRSQSNVLVNLTTLTTLCKTLSSTSVCIINMGGDEHKSPSNSLVLLFTHAHLQLHLENNDFSFLLPLNLA